MAQPAGDPVEHIFRVLGPVEVVGPDGALGLHSSRERIILTMLALSPNQPVSVDRLVDAVWDESPPFTARGQIQICVSRLRRALQEIGLPNRIVTRFPGYVLQVTDGELDLHSFEELMAEGIQAGKRGDVAECSGHLRQGLALFRGEPLADVDSRVLRSVALRISERRLTAFEECISAELHLDLHHEVLDELMALVAEHPLRGRLRELQMTALHRAGRHADALAAYQDARREHIDQLGVEPGGELRRLQLEILSSDESAEPRPILAEAHPVPRLLPPGIPDFTSRTAEVDLLRNGLRETISGNPGIKIINISGKGGVGKTSLALQVAHEVVDQFPDGQLYAQLRDADAQPVPPERVLTRFLRALGVAGREIPRGLQECAEMYRDRLAGRRVLLVLDDAADEHQVLPLMPGSATCRVLVTSRTRLGGLPGATRIYLDALDTESAMLMFERLAGRERVLAEPTYALELVRQCGGLPLALRVAAAKLNARPHWTIQQLTARLSNEMERLDALVYAGGDIRASIMVSYQDLDPDAKLLLARLALCEAAEFPAWIAAPLLDVEPDAASEVLDRLVDAQLVDAQWSAIGTRYRLHELIRVFAQERLQEDPEADRTAALGRVMSTWLFLIDEAHRRAYGGDYTLIHSGAPRRRLPPSWVDRLLARPLDWLDSERAAIMVAIGQARDIGADEVCWDLALSMITLFETHSYFEDWRDSVETALAAALRAGNRLGEAAMLYSGGTLDLCQRRLAESRARLTAAMHLFNQFGERHGAALALRNLAWLDRTQGNLDAALRRYSEALTILGEVGDLGGAAHVFYQTGQVNLERGDVKEAWRQCEAALEIGDAIDNSRIVAQVKTVMAAIQIESGDLERADRLLRDALRLVRAAGDKVGEAYALHILGVLRMRQGRCPAAERLFEQALALAQGGGDQLLVGKLYLAMGQLHRARGNHSLAATTTSQALNVFGRLDARLWHSRASRQLTEIHPVEVR